MTCTDVYVRPQSCDVIRIYPPQVHPGSRRRSTGPLVKLHRMYEDDVEIALALLNLLEDDYA